MSKASKKNDKYLTKDDTDELEVISEKLANDLRKNIRLLNELHTFEPKLCYYFFPKDLINHCITEQESYPILSDPWFEMAEIFGRIANISDMESKLSSPKNDGTLWETEEQALRFLLEDGKLNLCLRTLIDFKKNQIMARKIGKGPLLEYSVECDKFEKGVGVIMKNAWVHVEVLQTTDLPALIHHIADVLQAALDTPEVFEYLIRQGDIHQRQEILVFYYLSGLCHHVDEVKEHRFMPIIKNRGLIMLSIRILNRCSSKLLKIHRFKAIEALARLIETEDFITYRHVHMPNMPDDGIALFHLKENCMMDLIQDFETRKAIRPLIDLIDRTKRQLKLK